MGAGVHEGEEGQGLKPCFLHRECRDVVTSARQPSFPERVLNWIKVNQSQVAVIEGKWEKARNLTVKSFFDFVCELHFADQHAYHYEMFNNGTAFQEILPRMCSTNNIRHVYIAAHGGIDGILGSNGEAISITRIKNAVRELDNAKGALHSLYFGCCLFGQFDTIRELLEASNELTWIAGYTTSVDFIDSTLLDGLFWHHYIRSKEIAPLSRIKDAYSRIKGDAPGLMQRLGFKVAVRDERRRSESVYELV